MLKPKQLHVSDVSEAYPAILSNTHVHIYAYIIIHSI